jgi:DNA polymerase-3 subunit beta
MKFTVGSKKLQQQLAAVSKVINAKNALSILDNFLFKIEGNEMTITGSDQENIMTASLEIMDVEGEGNVAIPAKRILEILKEIPAQGLRFYINDSTKEIEIKFLNGHFNFMGVDGTEYPQKDAASGETAVLSVPANVISAGIDNTLFAVSPETIRPVLTGICIDFKEDRLVFVSSDTHKLVKFETQAVQPGFARTVILPSKPASILRSLLEKVEDNVDITIDDKGAIFKFDTYSLKCRFITGVFPNYDRVIPQDLPFELIVDRAVLLSAVKRVGIFANMASNLIKFNLQTNEILLSSQDLDYANSADERVECEYDGNSMLIGFNSTYVSEVLNNLKDNTIILKLADPARPGIFVPQNQPEEGNVLMLLMTMQIID